MNRTLLQIPLDKSLRDQAMMAATDLGFSSLQESVRVFLSQLAKRDITIGFGVAPIPLSPKAIHRYNRMLDDIDKGQNEVTTNSIEDFLTKLRSA